MKTTSMASAAVLVTGFTAVFSASSITAPTAQATETKSEGRSSTPVAGARAWTPVISPLDPYRETVKRNLSGAQRTALLNDCWPGYLCVAAGEGDGQHSVFELYYCTQRSLSNFIDAGAVVNHQAGGAVARLKRRDGSVARKIPADNRLKSVDWRPIWYLDPC